MSEVGIRGGALVFQTREMGSTPIHRSKIFCHHLLKGLGILTLNHENMGSNPIGDTNSFMVKLA